MHRQLWIALILICLAQPSYAAFVTEQDKQDYQNCTKQIKRNAAQALASAKQWVKRDNSAAAYHCQAMAEFSLRHYGNAATTLTLLHDRLDQDHISMKYQLRVQTARAWRLSGDAGKAEGVISQHIRTLLLADMSGEPLTQALHERATLYETKRQHLEALQDIDHALQVSDTPSVTLLRRARIYLAMNEKTLARQDVERALEGGANSQQAAPLLAALQ